MMDSWNERAVTLFGYTDEEVLGRPLTMLMPERYRQLHDKGVNRTIAEGRPGKISRIMEVHALRKDRSEFPIELSVASWQTEDGMFVTGIIRDIIRRKQAQEDLEQARALLEVENHRKGEELEKARELLIFASQTTSPVALHRDRCLYEKKP